MQCLNEGIEKGKHVREHPFIIVEPRIKSIFRTDWSAEEEELFLDAIQTYGLGNYQDIERLIPFKSAADYEIHYKSVYFGANAPKPEQFVDCPDVPVPPPSYPTEPVPSYPSDGNDEILKQNGKREAETPGELAGFMPMRREFEWEYREQGEELISNLEFDENDTENSFKIKLLRLQAYSSLVDEREIKTRTAIDFDLQNKNFSMPNEQTAEMKEATQKLLPLSPYIGRKGTMELIDLVKTQITKKSKIETRLRWKANGIRTHNEGFLYQNLENLISKDGKITDVRQWNKLIEDNNRKSSETESPESSLLDNQETELCHVNSIPTQLYLGLKDLIMREYAIRGSLTQDECADLDSSNSEILRIMYDHFVRVGWVCE